MTMIHWTMRRRIRVRVIGDSSNLQQRMIFLKNLEWTSSNLIKEIFSLCLGSVDGARQLSQIKLYWTDGWYCINMPRNTLMYNEITRPDIPGQIGWKA